ncbi:MAG: hypothetical protein U0354_12995 [Candidatus Sericytochromatia bacterium]
MSEFSLSKIGVINNNENTNKTNKSNNTQNKPIDDSLIKVRMFTQGSRINTNDQNKINSLRDSQNSVNTQDFSNNIERTALENTINNSSLTPQQKETAKKILKSISNDNLDDFKKLLGNGLLMKKDSAGITILDKMISEPRSEKLGKSKISASDILNQTVHTISNPLSIQQGDNKGTCGAATMEYILAKQNPAELVKIIEGITSKTQSVPLKNYIGPRMNTSMNLPNNAIPKDNSGRKDIDRMIQSSIMNQANLMGANYDNPSDDGGAIAVLGGNSAIPIGKFKDLYQSISGRGMDDPSCYLWGESDVAARVQSAVSKGENVPVLTSFGGKMAYHWLTAEKMTYDSNGKPDKIILRNPWGVDDASGAPPRKNLGNGLIEMKWSDFVKILDGAVVAKDLAGKPSTMPVQAKVDAIKTLMSGYTNGQEEQSIKDMLLNSSPQDLSDILSKLDRSQIVDELDPKDLAPIMKKLAQNAGVGKNAEHLLRMMQSCNDDKTKAFIQSMSDQDLKALASNPKGREALVKAWHNLDDGWTNDSEYKQMDRIKKATG